MEIYERECCIRGYHVYKNTWEEAIGEELECVCKQSNTVGSVCRASIEGQHNRWPLPKDVSAHLLVAGMRKYSDLPQGITFLADFFATGFGQNK